jgi:predicted dinucleotide-binding enzyme
MRRVSFIGAGNIGTSLAVLMKRAGYQIVAVSSRTSRSCENFLRYVKQGKICSTNIEAAELGDIIFITTNDDEIENVCKEISSISEEKILVHCSGALTTGKPKMQ